MIQWDPEGTRTCLYLLWGDLVHSNAVFHLNNLEETIWAKVQSAPYSQDYRNTRLTAKEVFSDGRPVEAGVSASALALGRDLSMLEALIFKGEGVVLPCHEHLAIFSILAHR